MPATVFLTTSTTSYATAVDKTTLFATVPFNPPLSVAGKPCLLKVATAFVETKAATTETFDAHALYIIELNIPQPQSYQFNYGDALQGVNRVVAAISKGFPGQAHPAIQVQCPASSTELEIVIRSNSIADFKSDFYVSLLMEITPIEDLSP